MRFLLSPLFLLSSVRACRASVRAARRDWEAGGRVVAEAETIVNKAARTLEAL